MPRPTLKAIQRKPRAVVNLAWMREEIEADHEIFPGDYDFEWFNNEEAMQEFYLYCRDFNEADWSDHGDVAMLVAEVGDTEKMELGRVHVVPHTAWMQEWKKRVIANPDLLIYKTKEEKEASEVPAAPTRGRGKSAAAQAASKKTAAKKTTAKKTAEEPKKTAAKKQVRRPSKAAEAAVKKDGAKNAPSPEDKKQALQRRLAARAGSKG